MNVGDRFPRPHALPVETITGGRKGNVSGPNEYARVPATLAVRELCVRVTRPGYRTRGLLVATTLLDAECRGN